MFKLYINSKCHTLIFTPTTLLHFMICGRREVEMTACNSHLRCKMGTKERLQRLRMVRAMPIAPAAVSAWPSCDLAAVSRSRVPVQINLLNYSEDHSLHLIIFRV